MNPIPKGFARNRLRARQKTIVDQISDTLVLSRSELLSIHELFENCFFSRFETLPVMNKESIHILREQRPQRLLCIPASAILEILLEKERSRRLQWEWHQAGQMNEEFNIFTLEANLFSCRRYTDQPARFLCCQTAQVDLLIVKVEKG
jgi:hypothetical protein